MYFNYFEFKNFKGIKSARIELSSRGSVARVTSLVGLNESGKTTILEAIDRFYPARDVEESGPKDIVDWKPSKPHELIPISMRANFNDTIEIRAEVTLEPDDVEAIRVAVRRKTGFKITEMPPTLQISNEYRFKDSKFLNSVTRWSNPLGAGLTAQGRVTRKISTSVSKQIWTEVVEAIRRRIPTIWYFPNFLFEFPDRIYLSEVENESSSNKLYRSLFQDILDSVGKNLTLDTHIVQRALSDDVADKKSLNQLKLDIGREVTRSVVHAWNELFHTNELQGKRVFVDIDVNPSVDGNNVVTATFSLEDADGLFAIRERSLGFRWFFVYLLLTTYRGRRRAEGGEVLFLFDEPASNLHSSAQSVLLQSLDRLSTTSFIVYTTHSHHLVNPSWLGSTFVVYNEGLEPGAVTADVVSASTDIQVERYAQFASRNPGRSHYFQPVLDVLDYRPSQLELVPDVVMTEGKSDYYLLRYYQRYLQVRDSGFQPLNFLPGTGSGTLAHPIQLYLAWSRPFVVLLDSDQSGTSAAKKYAELFGAEVEGLITDLASQISDSLPMKGIEALLDEQDRLQFQLLLDPSSTKYSKKLFSRAVEYAYSTGREVELSESSSRRISELVDSLATRLRGPRTT